MSDASKEPEYQPVEGPTYASCPANLKLSFWRYATRLTAPSWFLKLTFAFVGVELCHRFGLWIPEIAFAALLAVILVQMALRFARIRRFFRLGDLVPAKVLSLRPFIYISCADTSIGAGQNPVWAVKRSILDKPPLRGMKVGDSFACVTMYTQPTTLRPEIWSDFTPLPCAFATTRRAILEQKKQEIGIGLFLRLDFYVQTGQYPKQQDGSDLLYLS